jgi:cytochrome b561
MIDATQTAMPGAAVPAYTATARVLHWLTAVLVLIQIPLAIVIANEWGGPLQSAQVDRRGDSSAGHRAADQSSGLSVLMRMITG